MAQVEAAAASAEAVNLLAQEETRRRSAEEKFVKMKDVYQKLRDEHIGLIRGVSKRCQRPASVTSKHSELL